MIISVKTTGLPGKHRNRGDVELPDNSSVRTFLDQLAIQDERGMISINGELVQKEAFETTNINPDDEVVIMAPHAFRLSFNFHHSQLNTTARNSGSG